MNEYVIETFNLTKKFGKKNVLNNLNLKIKKGTIYGYLGRNGAGKTTTIKIVLGLIKQTEGISKVFGFDSKEEYVKIRQKVGYVSEDRSLYRWMKVQDAIKFAKGFFNNWDDNLAEQYLKKYGLDPSAKVSELSRGMLSKLFLAMALSHNPELLVLDEPTAALDPIVRGEFLDGLIDLAEQEGKTIFLATNNLNDVERIADTIGILNEGELEFSMDIDELKQKVRKVKLSFDKLPEKIDIEDILKEQRTNNEILLIIKNYNETVEQYINSLKPRTIDFHDMSLEEIFIEYLKEGK